jgi:uroporphyrinogen III methyltransferase/synthase
VTAPLGIAAYTGVPLTHREHTSVVTFVTGHNVDQIDWTKTGRFRDAGHLHGSAPRGRDHRANSRGGRNPETPAMAVRWGTRPDQQTISGKLADFRI